MLVANRGEIAVRVIRTLRELGIESVAVYSDADADARHVTEADLAVRVGPGPAAESYLDTDAILAACRATGAQAVHPGYGFLSENVDFARALAAAGIVFIGPGEHAILLMGDKIRAKNHVAAYGVPVVPGLAEPGLTNEQLAAAAPGIGFPLLIKPSAGGGGKGMVVVDGPGDLAEALASARRTAASAFGDDTLLLERLVASPRHIEVQVLADTHGNTVFLGERECSLQRRHQKVIEEAPAPLLESLPDGADIRERIGRAAVAAAASVGYVGAGTVEFLVSDEAPGEFFFMEMNTRLQVEHPVTEEVVRIDGRRIDLVAWQLRIAAGQRLDFTQDDVTLQGHAIEARLYAEEPARGFLPSTGTVLAVREPTGGQVRVDSALAAGTPVPPFYDPMLAKVIGTGPDRAAALSTLERALAGTLVLGVKTNTEYLRLLLADPDVVAGRLDTTLIERRLPELEFATPSPATLALAVHLHLASSPRSGGPWGADDGWRIGGAQLLRLTAEVDGATHLLGATCDGERSTIHHAGETYSVAPAGVGSFAVNGLLLPVDSATGPDGTVWINHAGWCGAVSFPTRRQLLDRRLEGLGRESGTVSPQVRSPMPGTVIAVAVTDGQSVETGDLLLVIEAMKMEHRLTAPTPGMAEIGHLRVGDLVKANQLVASIGTEKETAR
ncbi:acetyl/propionyl/methylcrotonyl-CoA carboxylase subunit alpha [Paeniglutamicibacter cryotolerans]